MPNLAFIFFAAAALNETWALPDRVGSNQPRRLSNSILEPLDKLTIPQVSHNFWGFFGFSVAIDGDTVVVGAHRDDPAGTFSGSVYIFRSYVEVAKLTAGDAAASDRFGYSVAIDGGIVVVGAYNNGNSGSASSSSGPGAAYVFRGDITYGQMAKLTASDAADGDNFGRSVAIDGNTVVVGASGDDDDGSVSGSVYVFHTSNGGRTYDQVVKLTAADAAASDSFGYSVAIDGGTIVVGAYNDGNTGSIDGSGSVYIFRMTDSDATYGQVAKLTAADGAAGDWFGRSVAIDGNTVVVGARNNSPVYVFRTTNGGVAYEEVATLPSKHGSFGRSVAIAGDTIVVGANSQDGPAHESGSAHVFRTSDGGASYGDLATLNADDTEKEDQFGNSVAIEGDTVLVGSRKAAYVFLLPAPKSHTSQQKKDDDNAHVAIVVTLVIVGAVCAAGIFIMVQKRREAAKSPSSAPSMSRPDSPAESPRDEPDEEATTEKIKVEESVEPSSFSKLTSFLFGEQEEAPKEEEAAALPVAEAEATKVPEADDGLEAPTMGGEAAEPSGIDATKMYHRMSGWYNEAPESAALRTAWGAYPTTPRALESWPGFVAVTNAFLDSSAAPPTAPEGVRFEAVDEKGSSWWSSAEPSAMEEHEAEA